MLELGLPCLAGRRRIVLGYAPARRDSHGRGAGDAYADLVRQSEKKPIRVFLQDGRNDNRGVGRGGAYDQRRDWFYQNVRLMQALTDKGYDVNYAWGLNTHGQRMGGPMLPEMMRWLWRDHPVSTDVNDTVERSFNAPKQK